MPDLSTIDFAQYSDQILRWGASGFWALVILVVGWIVAGWAERAVDGALSRVKRADPMLRGFFSSLARWGLLAFTGIAVLERLGFQTTSLVAVLGAAGLAIGLALQGTLSNLAAGVMLLLFRPFKVGDGIEAGGLAGSVAQVGLFHTHLVTGDNILVIAPNSVLWSASIRNLSAFPNRKGEMMVPIPYGSDLDAVSARIRELLAADQRVAADPAPAVGFGKFAEKNVELSVGWWCASGDVGGVKTALAAQLWKEFKLGAP